MNKLDLLPPEDVDQRCDELLQNLDWTGPAFRISALQRDGTRELCNTIWQRLAEAEDMADGT